MVYAMIYWYGISQSIYHSYLIWYIPHMIWYISSENTMVYHSLLVYHSMVYTMYVISHGICHTNSVISQSYITVGISHMWYRSWCVWYTMVYHINGIYQLWYTMVYHSLNWYIPVWCGIYHIPTFQMSFPYIRKAAPRLRPLRAFQHRKHTTSRWPGRLLHWEDYLSHWQVSIPAAVSPNRLGPIRERCLDAGRNNRDPWRLPSQVPASY